MSYWDKHYEGMLPDREIPGHRGYYPACNKAEWDALPAVYKAMDWCPIPDPLDKNKKMQHVKSVIFDVPYMVPYGINAKVSVHPSDVHNILFCSFKQYDCLLYSICGVELESGTQLGAKWLQDSTSGAFAVYAGGHLVGKQGGYDGYVPQKVEKIEDGNFVYKQSYHRKENAASVQNILGGSFNISHYTYLNPFHWEKTQVVERELTSTSKLIKAMVEYGMENSWCDSEVMDELQSLGVEYEDFVKAGFGDYAKNYFEENEKEPLVDVIKKVSETQKTSVDKTDEKNKEDMML